ncbi:MAG: hypothetical protein RMZ69_15010 [Nostoc sp. ChiQUE01a]|nr:hypothetical protein [Nostoc sp. ChiQUE01a]
MMKRCAIALERLFQQKRCGELSTFNKLKMGRQSTAGKAIEAFIKELNG